MSQTQFLNPDAKKVTDGTSYEFLGPAIVAQTTTITASATAAQIDANSALENRRYIEVRVSGATDEVHVGFDDTVSSTNGLPVVLAAPLKLRLSEHVPVWVVGSGTVTLLEEAVG